MAIQQGERIAICGSSGAGKSTIVLMLQRFFDVVEGEVVIDGVNIKNIPVKALREQIGIVSQEPVLFSGTIEQNICYGVDKYSKEELYEAARLSNALDFIENK